MAAPCALSAALDKLMAEAADPLRAVVFENLGNAAANGYALLDGTDEDIAADLQTCAADCEAIPTAALLPHIAAWRRSGRYRLTPA